MQNWQQFLRVFGYADDLFTLLCPTLSGLREMLNICEDYAKDYNILFNASKGKLMYFRKMMLIVMTFYLCLMVARLIMFSNVSTWCNDFF